MSEITRIGSIIIFHLSLGYEKPSSSYCVMILVWSDLRLQGKFEIDRTMGVK